MSALAAATPCAELMCRLHQLDAAHKAPQQLRFADTSEPISACTDEAQGADAGAAAMGAGRVPGQAAEKCGRLHLAHQVQPLLQPVLACKAAA